MCEGFARRCIAPRPLRTNTISPVFAEMLQRADIPPKSGAARAPPEKLDGLLASRAGPMRKMRPRCRRSSRRLDVFVDHPFQHLGAVLERALFLVRHIRPED